MDMRPPATVKEVQKLARRVAALGRFLPRSADRCNEFFKVLRSPEQFMWSDQCQQAFEELKRVLSNPLVLSTSMPSEDLFLYVVVSGRALSSMLARADG